VSRKLAFRLTGVLLLVWGSVPALAQQFSADLVRQKPQGAATTKVSVSGDKMRLEVTGQTKPSYVIMDLAKQTTLMVLPDTKTYIVSPPGRTPASIPFFHIDDPENACPAWEKSIAQPGTCKKLGADTVNTRSTVKYSGNGGPGDTGTAWVDSKLHFVTKWEGQKSVAELQNIQEGPQPASLFEVPSEYEKVDLAAARENAKKNKKPAPHK
jgi:hypothetical protein